MEFITVKFGGLKVVAKEDVCMENAPLHHSWAALYIFRRSERSPALLIDQGEPQVGPLHYMCSYICTGSEVTECDQLQPPAIRGLLGREKLSLLVNATKVFQITVVL